MRAMRRKKDGLDHQLKQNRQWRKETGKKANKTASYKTKIDKGKGVRQSGMGD